MKIKSKALLQYLTERRVLNAGDDVIALAKRDFRKLYKKQWKQNRVIKRHEVRPGFTPKEFYLLKFKAREHGLNPTAYCKTITLATLTNSAVIPKKHQLLDVYKHIGLALNTTSFSETGHSYLKTAESMLEKYLQECL